MPTLSHLTIYTPYPTLPNPLAISIPDDTTLEGWQTVPRSRHLPPTLHIHEILLKTNTPFSDPALDEDPDTDNPIPDRNYRTLYNALGWGFPFFHLYPRAASPYLAHLRTIICSNFQNHVQQVTLHLSDPSTSTTIIRQFNGHPCTVIADIETGTLDTARYYEDLSAIHAFLNPHFLAVSASRAHWLQVAGILAFSLDRNDEYVPIGARFSYNPAHYCNPTP